MTDSPPRTPQNGVDGSASKMLPDTYQFPTGKLKRVLSDSSKTPLVLISCGSFSPITYLHLRLFELAMDYARISTDFEVVGGYLSPVGDAYKKAGLASAEHRIRMCELAVSEDSWVDVDPWEALQKEYQPTAVVLDHFEKELNEVYGGIETYDGSRKPFHVALLAGADLIQTMSTPGVWSEQDLDHILGHYGAFVVERAGTDLEEAMSTLEKWKHNI
ncbi:Nicotinamide/nicotinic acid mononucleotide adenylyltransferase 1 [Coniosporium tulheliwenetii]|uniref:Nicotinamide/nicotinic acid mononucleotide adenylyltransferase 1 n=1 Tax=Coniosporium tulheliwenetii TaxID=3383036 RepID=A0ACC2YY32_9PEZI|nr:Nicotinamide/nicotinic acid mononucleotide adenylyltransferase 1 [Cladosporium sp. JES 115]